MVVKEGQQAIDYLTKATEPIDPTRVNHLHLNLINALLYIEIAHVSLAMEQSLSSLSKVVIDSTGFPEIDSWKVDIKNAFSEYKQFCAVRAKAMLPLLTQVMNASTTGINEAAQKAKKHVAASQALALAIEKLTIEQRDYLETAVNSKISTLPLSLSQNYPGFLIATFTDHPFYTPERYSHKNQQTGTKNGLKFVYHPLLPFILEIDTHTEDRKLRKQPTVFYNRASTSYYSYPPHGSRNEGDKKIVDSIVSDAEGLAGRSEWVKAAFTSLETASFTNEEVVGFLQILPEVDSLISGIISFYDNLLNGNAITPEEFDHKNTIIANRMEKIFEKIGNDNLKRKIQIAIAQSVEPTRKKAESIATSPTSSSPSLAPTNQLVTAPTRELTTSPKSKTPLGKYLDRLQGKK